jgi:phage/plasmid-associated DNA primase
MKTSRIQEFADRFFTDENGVKTYLPIEVSVKKNLDGSSSKIPKGSRQSFRYKNFQELTETEQTTYTTASGENKVYQLEGVNDGVMITYKNCSFYELSLSSTRGVFVIDIDDIEKYPTKTICLQNVPEILRDMPYTLSTTKNLPHFFFMLDEDATNKIQNLNSGKSLGSDNLNFCKGDFLCSAIWEKKDKLVFNWDERQPLKVLSLDDLCGLLSEELATQIRGAPSLTKHSPRESVVMSIIKDEDDDDTTTVEENEVFEEEKNEVLEAPLPNGSRPTIAIKLNKQRGYKGEDTNELNTKVCQLAECWKPERIGRYDGFVKFTFAIQNMYKDDTGLEVWDAICKKYDGYNQMNNMRTWNDLKKRKKEGKTIGMGTLVHWAKEDNLELFNSLFQKDKIDWGRLTEATFADRLCSKEFFGETVLFTGYSKDMEGFKYNGVYWEQLGVHNALLKKGYFEKLYTFYNKKFDDVEMLFEEKDARNIRNNIKVLDSAITRNHIIDIIKTNKYEPKILWNQSPTLFAFTDCIFDLETGEKVNSSRDQYINTTCGYAYGLDTEDYSVEEGDIMTFLESVFESEELRKFMLKVLASFLRGNNIDEKIFFWLGSGRNGKGALTTLLEMALGDYYGNLNLTYYTEYKRGEDSANNNLYSLRNARILNTAEVGESIDPTKPQRFLTDKLKTITGNDKIRARQNFSKANEDVEFCAGSTVVQLNLMPIIVGIEKPENISLRGRAVVCPFQYSFTDDNTLIASNPQKYKSIDKTLKDKFRNPRYRDAFIRLLLKSYKLYHTEGLDLPEEVRAETMRYFDNSNKVKTWFMANLEKDEANITNEINIPTDAYIKFIETTGERMTKGKFKESLEEMLGKCGKQTGSTGIANRSGIGYIKGYKWIGDSEED